MQRAALVFVAIAIGAGVLVAVIAAMLQSERYLAPISADLPVIERGFAERAHSLDFVEGTGLDMPYRLRSVNEPERQPDDLDVAAASFWLDSDLETMLATVKPNEGPGEFVIEDLTDDEWDRFVAALSE